MMKLLCLAFATTTALGQYTNDAAGFGAWMAIHGKNYTVTEQAGRQQIWQENFKVVEKHNQEASEGIHSFTLGMNSLADLTNEEYRRVYLNYNRKVMPSSKARGTFDPSSVDPPASVDWRTHSPSVISPIKNQGQCGSCWAFSAVEAMEAAAALRTGASVTPGSPQQLVDCVDGGADTCNRGGEMHDGYLEVIKQGGLDTEASYSYQGTSGHACAFKAGSIIPGTNKFTGYENVTAGDETALMAAVATYPTISVAIDASSLAFQLYFGGVFDHEKCGNKVDQLDHGVAVVGYGVKSGKNYWLVRNSWGTFWGEKGYILMSKDKDNQCGIADDATYLTF